MGKVWRLTGVGTLALLAAACGKSGAGADAPENSLFGKPGAVTGRPYHVVVTERPESVDQYHTLYKATYEGCAGVREIRKLPPPPPMLQPPPDFISKRTTYASDGRNYMVKEENFTYDAEIVESDLSCPTRLKKNWSVEIIRDGKAYRTWFDDDSGLQTDPPEPYEVIPEPDSKTDIYTEARSVNGVALRCLPPMGAVGFGLENSCIVDLKPGTLTDAANEPLAVTGRVTIPAKGWIMLTELKSLKVDAPDPALFDPARAGK